MSYTASVPKEPALGIRLEADEKAALEAAAKSDQRPLSAMGRKIIADWLRANGWLGEGPALGPGRERSQVAESHKVSLGGLKKALDRHHKRKRMEQADE